MKAGKTPQNQVRMFECSLWTGRATQPGSLAPQEQKAWFGHQGEEFSSSVISCLGKCMWHYKPSIQNLKVIQEQV